MGGEERSFTQLSLHRKQRPMKAFTIHKLAEPILPQLLDRKQQSQFPVISKLFVYNIHFILQPICFRKKIFIQKEHWAENEPIILGL